VVYRDSPFVNRDVLALAAARAEWLRPRRRLSVWRDQAFLLLHF
jgi:hypothetical protein